MKLKQLAKRKWAITNGKGFVLCERDWGNQEEARLWARAYFSSWTPPLSFDIELLSTECKSNIVELGEVNTEKSEAS